MGIEGWGGRDLPEVDRDCWGGVVPTLLTAVCTERAGVRPHAVERSLEMRRARSTPLPGNVPTGRAALRRFRGEPGSAPMTRAAAWLHAVSGRARSRETNGRHAPRPGATAEPDELRAAARSAAMIRHVLVLEGVAVARHQGPDPEPHRCGKRLSDDFAPLGNFIDSRPRPSMVHQSVGAGAQLHQTQARTC